MNIALIVDPYGEEKPGGLGRAILEIARGILREASENEFVVYVKNQPAHDAFGEGVEIVPLNISHMWRGSPRLKKSYDLFIFFTPVIPLFLFPKKSIVVVHDFAYLEIRPASLKEHFNKIFLFVLHALSLRKATTVVAVSETAKRATIKHFGIKGDKIHVIYNGFIESRRSPEAIATPEPFFLFAGVLKERKNVHGVIRGFEKFSKSHPNHSLLIVGKMGGGYAERMQKLVDDLNLGEKVKFMGYVRDEELEYLYGKAEALVFPSLVEGFGMPILEAMSAGTPVITSNIGALAEVAGDAAVLVDPYDPDDIARGMQELADSITLRSEYKRLGTERAKQFSWDKNARAFAELIENI